jgi:hypothetical protein
MWFVAMCADMCVHRAARGARAWEEGGGRWQPLNSFHSLKCGPAQETDRTSLARARCVHQDGNCRYYDGNSGKRPFVRHGNQTVLLCSVVIDSVSHSKHTNSFSRGCHISSSSLPHNPVWLHGDQCCDLCVCQPTGCIMSARLGDAFEALKAELHPGSQTDRSMVNLLNKQSYVPDHSLHGTSTLRPVILRSGGEEAIAAFSFTICHGVWLGSMFGYPTVHVAHHQRRC